MSRIGKAIIKLPQGVELKVDENNLVTVKGPLGELSEKMRKGLTIEQTDGVVKLNLMDESKQANAYHGLYRSLINNMVIGVSKGYEKQMELVGVGFRAAIKGQELAMSLGYSHNLVFQLPKEINAEAKMERGKNPLITLKSNDKQLLGQVCAKIRSLRKPEPYKGKGIRFLGEQIRRKAGKAAAKA